MKISLLIPLNIFFVTHYESIIALCGLMSGCLAIIDVETFDEAIKERVTISVDDMNQPC